MPMVPTLLYPGYIHTGGSGNTRVTAELRQAVPNAFILRAAQRRQSLQSVIRTTYPRGRYLLRQEVLTGIRCRLIRPNKIAI